MKLDDHFASNDRPLWLKIVEFWIDLSRNRLHATDFHATVHFKDRQLFAGLLELTGSGSRIPDTNYVTI